ncbi:MAG: 30S ribosomal protein S20 [Elusimicrobiota bacterium]
MAKLKTGRHTSAQKAERQALRNRYRNRAMIKKAKEESKAALAAAGDAELGKNKLSSASSQWDKAVKKGGVHWKTAARRKSRLAAKVKKAAAKS